VGARSPNKAQRSVPEILQCNNGRFWPEASVRCVAIIRPKSGGEADMPRQLNRRE
jgi:hypothetical protein